MIRSASQIAILLVCLLASTASAQPVDGDSKPPIDASDTDSWNFVTMVHDIWTFDLFSIKGEEVRVNQIVLALLILLIGLWLSGRLAKFIARRAIRMPRMRERTGVVLEKITFYVLAIVVFLVSLQTVGIPITAFAVLGGAFAIGLGFGAQTLFNNFISGVILLFERPIRIGDVIQIEDSLGKVESINARCTYIKRVDGVDLLVPNSKLLENNVINWTRSDKEIRTSIITGVIYGSPTELVAQILEQCVREHPRVLTKKPINVIFDDFGDNSLVFETYFWTEVETSMELRVIRSEIRFAIDRRFREQNIIIAFPQRDIHMDTVRPLQVELVQSTQARSAS